MKMKRLTILLLFIALITTVSATGRYNQQQRLSPQEYREKQKAFIIEKAQLTPAEADKFFPLFFELQEKKKAMNDKVWEMIKTCDEEKLSEQQYGAMLDDIYNTRIAVDELEKSYLTKYLQILTNKKIFQIQKAEIRFHRELLKTMNPGRGGGKNNNDKKQQ